MFACNKEQIHTAVLIYEVVYERVYQDCRSIEKMGNRRKKNQYIMLGRRIEGAVKFGNTWAIPADAEKPKDDRIKSGKYIKNGK